MAKKSAKKTLKTKPPKKTKGGIKVEVMTDFKHGRESFTQGDVVTLPNGLAKQFIDLGWAVKQGDAPPQGMAHKDAVLSIDKGRIGTSSNL